MSEWRLPDAQTTAARALYFIELDASKTGLAELSHFYSSLYVAAFPDPDERESLSNMKRYLALKESGFYGRNNYHIVLVERGGELLGGIVSDYLAEPNTGVIEFLFISPKFRGLGFGKALLEQAEHLFRIDARMRTARPLKAVVAEMNDPFRRPSTPDNMDPFERALIWAGWGFGKLELPYVQPALSRNQAPGRGLVLLAKLARSSPTASVRAPWVQSVVGEYMRWAMRIPTPERNPEFQEMARWLSTRRRVAITPLARYVGRDSDKPFRVLEVRGRGDNFRDAVRLIQSEVKGEGRIASASQFARALALRGTSAVRYHLWALQAPHAARAEGAASFFTLPKVGFGGYLVLAGRLRGHGLLRQLIARIEQQMLRDRSHAEGWLIETGPESRNIFLRCGFQEVEVDYRPPPVGSRARWGRAAPERLHLLYKPFGSVHSAVALTDAELLDAVASVLELVYGVKAPRQHACYLRLKHAREGRQSLNLA